MEAATPHPTAAPPTSAPTDVKYHPQGADIIVDGKAIPFIKVHFEAPTDGEELAHLVIDQRFGLTLPTAQVSGMAWWLANLVAVAQGYPAHNVRVKPPGLLLPPSARRYPGRRP